MGSRPCWSRRRWPSGRRSVACALSDRRRARPAPVGAGDGPDDRGGAGRRRAGGSGSAPPRAGQPRALGRRCSTRSPAPTAASAGGDGSVGREIDDAVAPMLWIIRGTTTTGGGWRWNCSSS